MATLRKRAGLAPERELRRVTLQAMRSISLPASNDEINSAVADRLELTPEQRAVMHSNGTQSKLVYDTAWARTALKTAGAAENVGRALWALTEEGDAIAPDVVDQRYESHLAELKTKRPGQQGTTAESPPRTPEDDKGVDDDLDWTKALKDRLIQMSPSGFEHLSAALLRAAGFDEVEVTGSSSDGGIDGIGVYRPSGLISFHIAFQCKRYQGSVSASTVRDFRGSFIGRADRGIILTTGTFTRDARGEAQRAGANPIDLIDGNDLCDLLQEHSLGVRTTTRTVEDIMIDDIYFNQFENSS